MGKHQAPTSKHKAGGHTGATKPTKLPPSTGGCCGCGGSLFWLCVVTLIALGPLWPAVRPLLSPGPGGAIQEQPPLAASPLELGLAAIDEAVVDLLVNNDTIQHVFDAHDADDVASDMQRVDQAELTQSFKELGIDTVADAEQFDNDALEELAYHDTDTDGTLDRAEFVAAMQAKKADFQSSFRQTTDQRAAVESSVNFCDREMWFVADDFWPSRAADIFSLASNAAISGNMPDMFKFAPNYSTVIPSSSCSQQSGLVAKIGCFVLATVVNLVAMFGLAILCIAARFLFFAVLAGVVFLLYIAVAVPVTIIGRLVVCYVLVPATALLCILFLAHRRNRRLH